MSRTTLLLISLAAIFLLAVAVALHQLDKVGDREVVNRYRGGAFSFTYPLGFEIEEYPNGSIAIGSTTGSGFVSAVDLTVTHAVEGEQYESADAFHRTALLNLCAADAPGERVYCEEIERSTDAENADGTNLKEYHLVLKRERGGNVETSTFGPIYAYVLPPGEEHVTGTPYPILFIHPPLPSVLAGTIDLDLLTRINNSVFLGPR